MRSDGKESKLSGFYSALTSWSWSWSLWAHVCVPSRVRECTCLCLRCSESMCLEREAWGGWNAQVGVSGPEVSPILLPLLLKYWGWICNKGHTNEDTVLLKVILRELSLNVAHLLNSYIVPVIALDQWFSTGVLQEFLTHAIPDCVVRGTDLFSLRLLKKKNDNSQHNSAPPVWTNQNYTYFLLDRQKIYFLVCPRILVISLCATS